MLLDPNELQNNLDRLEEIEKVSLRLIVQAILDFKEQALEIFQNESDLVADIGEDITREALDRLGVSKSTSDYSEKWITKGRDMFFILIMPLNKHYL